MHNIGDLDKMSMLEMNSLWPGLETLEMAEREIGNISPESYIEDGKFSRLCTQFNWGTRYTPPFSHSQDAINCVTATLGKMGNWAKSTFLFKHLNAFKTIHLKE